MSDFAFISISIRLYVFFSVTFSFSSNQNFITKHCTQYLQPICVVCNFSDRNLWILASKLSFISQKLWHTILNMSYSSEFFGKSSKIPLLYSQESRFSIVCNFFAHYSTILDINFRT